MEVFLVLFFIIFIVILFIRLGSISELVEKTNRNIEKNNKQIKELRELVEQMKSADLVEKTDMVWEKNEQIETPEIVVNPVNEVISDPIQEETTYANLSADQTSPLENEEIKQEIEQPIEVLSEDPFVEKEVVEEKTSSKETIRKPKVEKKTIDYERFIGENLFGKIGILVFILGVGFFVKYAIDQNWINETMRTVLGFGVGLALFGVGHKLREKYHTFSSLLVGGCFAVFYITDAIAYHYYNLYGHYVGLAIIIVSTILMVLLSILYDRRELAVIALVGGFLAPFIIHGDSKNIVSLLIYILILDLGMFVLAMYKRWGELPVLTYMFTLVIVIIAIAQDYDSKSLLIFSTIYYFVFLLPVFYILKFQKTENMSKVLISMIILNNFTYFALGCSLLNSLYPNQDYVISPHAIFCIFLALVNVGISFWMFKVGHDFLKKVSIALAVVFVTLFVPMQFSGSPICLVWSAEMVVLLWLFIHSKMHIYEYGSLALFALTLLVTCFSAFDYDETGRLFANQTFISNLFVSVSFLAMALLMEKYKASMEIAKVLHFNVFNPLFYILSVITCYTSIMLELERIEDIGICWASIALLTSALVGLVCFLFRFRFKYEEHIKLYSVLMSLPVLFFTINILKFYGKDTFIFTGGMKSPNLQFFLLLLTAVLGILCMIVVAREHYKKELADSDHYIICGKKVDKAHYKNEPIIKKFTILLNILAMIELVALIRLISLQMGFTSFRPIFSVVMALIGFAQMCLGMKLHMKVLRIISLVTFGIVLGKLLLFDLWSMPSLGKIIVFVLLGLILLILSFLYQKLKVVLFEDEIKKEDTESSEPIS